MDIIHPGRESIIQAARQQGSGSEEPGDEVALLLRAALATEHLLAVALEPLLHLAPVAEASAVDGRRERLDHLAREREPARARIRVWQPEQETFCPSWTNSAK